MEEKQEKIIKADSGAKRRVLILCAAMAVAGILIFKFSYDYLQGLREMAGEDLDGAVGRIVLFIQAWFAIAIVSVAGIAAYLAFMAVKVLKTRQMPPPGTRVIRDTKVIEGERAVTRAKALLAMAVVVAVVGIAMSWQAYSAFSTRMLILKDMTAEGYGYLVGTGEPPVSPPRPAGDK